MRTRSWWGRGTLRRSRPSPPRLTRLRLRPRPRLLCRPLPLPPVLPARRGMWLRSCVTWGRCIIAGRLMMRRSLPNCTNFFPGCDVKYLAPGRCDASGGLYRPCALNPCGASRRTGTCGGLVAVPGFEPGCPLGHVLLRDACIRSTRQRDSPCLLVKGTDCAGVTRARGACGGPGLCVFCFSVLMGRSNTLTSPSGLARSFAGCRVASVGTVCPTYLPRALCSPIPASPLAQLSAGEGRRPWAVLSAACESPRQHRVMRRGAMMPLFRWGRAGMIRRAMSGVAEIVYLPISAQIRIDLGFCSRAPYLFTKALTCRLLF